MRILYFGDVVGRPGRRAVELFTETLREREEADLIVLNGENASGGLGIDERRARDLFRAGADVITSGNHIWHRKEIYGYIGSTERLLRPQNYAPGVPGRGWVVVESRSGVSVGVLNLIGRVFMGPADCPFRAADAALPEIRERAKVVLVDMHGEATSEKVAMGRYLDGRVSAVVGSHTHVQTADDGVFPGGTAYISDAGMCGPVDSVIGMRTDQVVQRFLDQLPVRFEVPGGPAILQGVVIDVNEATGRARSIRRIRESTEEAGISE